MYFLNVLFYFGVQTKRCPNYCPRGSFETFLLSFVLLLLDPLRVCPGNQVPRVHEPIHTHGNAFLESSWEELFYLNYNAESKEKLTCSELSSSCPGLPTHFLKHFSVIFYRIREIILMFVMMNRNRNSPSAIPGHWPGRFAA